MTKTKRQRHLLTLAAGTLLLAAGTARADRPLVSETADVIGAGQCQVETGLARHAAGQRSGAHGIRIGGQGSGGGNRRQLDHLGLPDGRRSSGGRSRAEGFTLGDDPGHGIAHRHVGAFGHAVAQKA